MADQIRRTIDAAKSSVEIDIDELFAQEQERLREERIVAAMALARKRQEEKAQKRRPRRKMTPDEAREGYRQGRLFPRRKR